MKKYLFYTLLSFLFINYAFGQTTIYQQNFDAVSIGKIPVSSSSQDGWLVNGSTNLLYGSYEHRWGIHSGGSAIASRSLGLSFYNGTNLFSGFGYQYTNCGDDSRADLAAYRVISTVGYQSIQVTFDWKAYGELYNGVWYDYGQVGYSITGGAPFTWITTGGTANGQYRAQTTATQTGATVSFPASCNNTSNFTLAFRAKLDECGGTSPVFIIDNVVVEGTSLSSCVAGTASPTYQYVPTNNSANFSLTGQIGTTIQWQVSSNGTSGWTNVVGGSGASTTNFTTANLTNGNYFYRAVVTDGGSCIQYSNVVEVAVAASPVYCSGAGTGNATFNNHIEGIGFHEWTDPTIGGTNGYVSNNYLDYTDTTTYGYATVVAGQYHHLNAVLRAQGSGTNSTTFAYWIDWNGDGVFTNTASTSGGERMDNINYTSSTGNSYAAYFTVPPSASGTVRIRVRAVRGNLGTLNPCTAYSSSQTKDFTIKILPSIGSQVCNGVNGNANNVLTNSTLDKVNITSVKVDGPNGNIIDNNSGFFGIQTGGTTIMYNYSNMMGSFSEGLVFEAGQSYTIEVEHSGYTAAAGLFIDWDGNGIFSGANELINVISSTSANAYVFNFTTPLSITDGQQVAMRVRLQYESFQGEAAAMTGCNNILSGLNTYSEVEDYRATLSAPVLVCAQVANLTTSIGNPAFGLNHHLNVNWDALSGSIGYDIEVSTDGTFTGTPTTSTASNSFDFDAGDNPNTPYWFQVRAKDGTQTCAWTTTGPIYTAADMPELPVLSNVDFTSMDLQLANETPVNNPAITTYSIFENNSNQFVQADGTLGATEVFQTKTTWGTINVNGLSSNTNYCFLAKAKNNDGYETGGSGATIFTTQSFDATSSLATGTSNTSVFWSPATCTTGGLNWNATNGCSDGAVGYAGSFNSFFGCFLRTPTIDATGLDEIVLTFDVSHSFDIAHLNNRMRINYYADGGYVSNTITSLKINGTDELASFGANGQGISYDALRNCASVEVKFDISALTNKSDIMFYLEPNSLYNDNHVFSTWIDNVSFKEAAQVACETTLDVTRPNAPVFHDFGGTDQLAFNNSYILNSQPIFRVSAQNFNPTYTNLEIEISTDVNFSSVLVSEDFTGVFNSLAEVNHSFSSIGTLTANTTYYVRARASADAGVTWGNWSSDTYSFTYKPASDLAWYQTTVPQFLTDNLVDLNTFEAVDRVSLIEGSEIAGVGANTSFENSTSWTGFATGGSEVVTTISDGSNWSSDGSRAARMYMFGGFALSSDVGVVSQVVDLTNVEQITFDANSYYGQNLSSSLANGGTLRLIIGGTSTNASGTVVTTINHCTTGSSGTCTEETLDNIANIPLANRSTNQLVKFVWTGFTQGDLGGALVDFQVDNVKFKGSSTNTGKLTSTPINLASFQDGDTWDQLFWEQTRNNGTLDFSIEKFDGTAWTAISGLTNISESTDGAHTFDISAAGSEAVIRVVADFVRNGPPELFNFGLTTTPATPLPVSWLNVATLCLEKGLKINWSTATEINNNYFEVLASINGRDFESLGKINGAGNSNEINNYSFKVEKQNKYKHFRLKQTDFDGKFEFSKIVTANCFNFSSSLEIYPNPFDGSIFYINYTNEVNDLTVKIYDLSGQFIEKPLTHKTGANIQVTLSKQLTEGVYFVEVYDQEGFVAMKKLITK